MEAAERRVGRKGVGISEVKGEVSNESLGSSSAIQFSFYVIVLTLCYAAWSGRKSKELGARSYPPSHSRITYQ